MEEIQLELATTGRGGIRTDVTTSIEGMESSSFAAADGHSPFNPNNSCSTACRSPGNSQKFRCSCPCVHLGGARTICGI